MNDTELIYSLYVQANPVPDPDALPLTPSEAELLTHERSTPMDTRERIEVRPTPPARPRLRPAFGLAAVLVVAVAAAAIVLFVGGEDDGPVAAADAAPRVVFDGNSCRYDGPTLIEQGNATLTLANTSAEPMNVSGFLMPESELAGEFAGLPLGTDMALRTDSPMPAGRMALSVDAEPGSEGVGPATFLPGTYLLDCLYYESASQLAPAHVWRAQTTIEVVAP